MESKEVQMILANPTGKGVYIPKHWVSDIWVSPDRNADMLAHGRNAKGKMCYIFSKRRIDRGKKEKYKRLLKFSKIYSRISKKIEQDKDKNDAAAALYLISLTGFRIGGKRDTGAAVKAYGASTLRSEHVKVLDGTVQFKFIGKSGVPADFKVKDEWLANKLRNADPGKPVFNTDEYHVRKYFKKIPGSKKLLVKDFRLYTGTSLAAKTIATMPTPETKKALKQAKNAVADVVAKKLNNTRGVALSSYIAPEVFYPWEGKLSDKKKA